MAGNNDVCFDPMILQFGVHATMHSISIAS